MPIFHKFLQKNWHNGFETHNAILDTVPYKPEVIFIGTFNHGWPWNVSDFFYGRGMYMWTIFGNMFLHNGNHWILQRRANNNMPTLPQLFEICEKGKIVFADIVLGTKSHIHTQINLADESVLVDNQYLWRSYKDQPLDVMGANGWLDDNVKNIIAYIQSTPSIKHIYFTFKSGDWVVTKKNLIVAGVGLVPSSSIFSPTANGFGVNLPAPLNERAWSLAHQWVWNGQPHAIPVNRVGYGHLDHNWLISKGVNPNNF
jgi:hypothetical protein